MRRVPGVAVIVPLPHEPVTFGVAATTTPAGRLSVNATPLKATLVFGLLMLKLNVLFALRAMLVGLNDLVIAGGLATVSVAVLLVAPVPPLVELTAPVVLLTVPDCVPVTFTTIVPVEPGVAMFTMERLMLFVFAVAFTVPPQLFVSPGVDATCNPLVSVSLNAIPVSALVLLAGLVMVNVTVVVPFSAMFAAPNALLIVGGATTVKTAVLLVVPVPPSVEVTAPVVLLLLPALVPVTFTEKLQVDPAAGDAVNDPLLRVMVPLPAVAVTVPLPQAPVSPFGVATTTPAGRLSVNAMPLSVLAVFGLVMGKLSVLLVFNATLVGLKLLLMVGGAITSGSADAGLPVPPLVELTEPVVLVYWPAAAPVTVTENTHWLFTAIVAPVSVIPVGFVVVSVPPQVLDELLATVSPVGSVSLNATPVSATVFAAGLVIVNCNELVALRAMLGGATTVRVAVLLVVPVPPSVEVIAPVVLFSSPALVPVTFTEKVQEDPAAGDAVNDPLLRVMVLLPAVAVTVPLPQAPVSPFGVATTTPAGRLSVNAIPLSALAVFGFVMVKLSVLFVFSGTLIGLKALLMVGGATTMRLAVPVLPLPALPELTRTLLLFTPAVVP